MIFTSFIMTGPPHRDFPLGTSHVHTSCLSTKLPYHFISTYAVLFSVSFMLQEYPRTNKALFMTGNDLSFSPYPLHLCSWLTSTSYLHHFTLPMPSLLFSQNISNSNILHAPIPRSLELEVRLIVQLIIQCIPKKAVANTIWSS
jgi:hypothetical protein